MLKKSLSLVPIDSIKTATGTLLVVQGHKRGIDVYYCKDDLAIKCPYKIIQDEPVLHSMYFSGKSEYDYVDWFYSQIETNCIAIETKVLLTDVWGYVELHDIIKHGVLCNVVFLPKLDGRLTSR